MEFPNTFLEIHVHLCDGNVSRFVQSDRRAAHKMLDSILPDRLFTQRHLILAEDHAVTVYPCSAVTRVDFVMDGFPNWPFHHNVIDIVEITPDEFQARYDPLTMRTDRQMDRGQITRVFGEIELDNGSRIFREVHLLLPPGGTDEERIPLDRNVFFQQLFLAPSLHFRRRGGGAILINPDHIVRMTFYPGPSDTPANAWPVHREVHKWQYA